MRGYVRECQKQGQEGGVYFVPQSQARIWLRNLMCRTLPYMPWKGLVVKMAMQAGNAIMLKDYAV